MRNTPTKRNRVLLGAALVTAAAVALTGCGRSADDGSAAGGGTIDDTPATGTLEIWTQGTDGSKLPEMFDEFTSANPDVEIKMTEIPSEEFATKMTAAVTAGTVPDLIYAFTETQPPLIATGGFDSIPDDFVDEADFFPAMWDASIADGVQYGVPWYTYANMMYYRADLAEAAGVEAPTDWEGLRTFAQDMQASGVEYPLSILIEFDDYTAWQLGIFAAQNGGSFISEDGSEWTINEPENVEALEFWAGLIADGYASPDGPLFLDIVPWMSDAKTASILDGGPWFSAWFDDAKGEEWSADNLAFVPNPTGPTGIAATTTGGGSWLVPTDAENKVAAWKFARYMSEPSSQVEWFKIFGNMPAVKAAWDDPALSASPVLTTVREALDTGVNRPKVSTWTQVGKVIGQEMERVVRGGISAQEALDNAQKQAEAIGMGSK